MLLRRVSRTLAALALAVTLGVWPLTYQLSSNANVRGSEPIQLLDPGGGSGGGGHK